MRWNWKLWAYLLDSSNKIWKTLEGSAEESSVLCNMQISWPLQDLVGMCRTGNVLYGKFWHSPFLTECSFTDTECSFTECEGESNSLENLYGLLQRGHGEECFIKFVWVKSQIWRGQKSRYVLYFYMRSLWYTPPPKKCKATHCQVCRSQKKYIFFKLTTC